MTSSLPLGFPHLWGSLKSRHYFYNQYSVGLKGQCLFPALRSSRLSQRISWPWSPEQEGNAISPIPSSTKALSICFSEMFALDSVWIPWACACMHCGPADGWLCFSWFPGCRRTSNNAVSSWCLSPQPVSQKVLPTNFQTTPFSVPSSLLQGLECHWSIKW